MNPAQDILLSETEAAALLALRVTTLRNWRARRIGPKYSKIGARAVRYRVADVQAFIDAGVRDGAQP